MSAFNVWTLNFVCLLFTLGENLVLVEKWRKEGGLIDKDGSSTNFRIWGPNIKFGS